MANVTMAANPFGGPGATTPARPQRADTTFLEHCRGCLGLPCGCFVFALPAFQWCLDTSGLRLGGQCLAWPVWGRAWAMSGLYLGLACTLAVGGRRRVTNTQTDNHARTQEHATTHAHTHTSRPKRKFAYMMNVLENWASSVCLLPLVLAIVPAIVPAIAPAIVPAIA